MENMGYRGVAMGGRIYALRMAKEMTQEQLAAVLCVSPAAVSKWERNVSNPNIEMIWALADFFGGSIDELVGRTVAQVHKVGVYDEEKIRLVVVAEDLLKCCDVSRAKGLIAMEEEVPRLKSGSRFLAFAVPYICYLFMEQADPELAFRLLGNYAGALPKAERTEGHMITAALKMIFSGERRELIQEQIASYIGMEYREKWEGMGEALRRTRKEILERYKDKKLYSDATDLLEGLVHLGNFEIQTILRNLDNGTLTAALMGASGGVVTAFLSNLADRVLYLTGEDMARWQGTEEEILAAQRKVLELSGEEKIR